MKKLLSVLLVAAMILGLMPMGIMADGNSLFTVYVTVCRHGEFVQNQDGQDMAIMPIEMDGNDSYNLDDVFKELHRTYYVEDEYESADGEFGAYITKFWGDESGNYGYQINGGEVFVMGLSHEVCDGDYIDVAIYKNYYPDTESYTKFEKYEEEVTLGESIELSLFQAGYDENWNTVFSACEDVEIIIDGESTGITTDFDGKVSLNFDEVGTYVISARKDKEVNNESVPSITSPVCKVVVKEPEHLTLMHNIANKYAEGGLLADGNMEWLIADLTAYSRLYDDSLTISEKQKCLDKIIADAYKTTSPSSLAKSIIALRAMGYDAKKVYRSDSSSFDIVAKLLTYVDSMDAAATNVYTLPFVIIALQQADGYATEEQISALIDAAISSKGTWLNDEWGTDAASFMLLALAPYYNSNEEVKNAVDEGISLLISSQDENGAIGNAASTGLAIAALSALGTDADTIVNNDFSLIDGLMNFASEDLYGFEPLENTFSTEQGFRGLLAWQLLNQENGLRVYDFSSQPMDEAYSTKKKPTFSGGGGGGGGAVKEPETKDEEKTEEITDDKQAKQSVEKVEKLPENINPDVKIMPVISPDKTFLDIKDHKNKAEIEALAQRGIINGKSENSFDPESTMTRAEFATIITRGLGLPQKEAAIFNDVDKADWFYNYINTAYSYGIIKGVSDTEFDPNGTITRQEAAVMVARAAKLCGMDTVTNETLTRDTISIFTDYIYIESWAKDSMAFCLINGIVSDEGAEIMPTEKISRAEVASMVYSMLDKSTVLSESGK